MQVQSFMQKLHRLPQICSSSSRTFREVIDTVHKYINGLKKYIKMDESHPHAVFAVIAKMDTDTYRAWEKHRPSLAKANAEQNGDPAIAARPGKYIPKWSELESFLESEVNVRMHAERREGLGKAAFQGAPTSRKQQKQEFKKQNDHKKGKAPDSVRCPICQGGHYIYNCQQFIDMNLMARLNKVTELQLCVRCLWPVHSNACVNKRNNMDCLNCMPEKRRHNSKLCPNAKNSANAVLKASKQPRKRKQNDNGQQSNKRRKFNGNRPKSERPPAAAHKVSDWSPASNAMASMPKLPKPTNHDQ